MKNGVYRRTWVNRNGQEESRMLLVLDGMVLDLPKVRWKELADVDRLPGKWEFVQEIGRLETER